MFCHLLMIIQASGERFRTSLTWLRSIKVNIKVNSLHLQPFMILTLYFYVTFNIIICWCLIRFNEIWCARNKKQIQFFQLIDWNSLVFSHYKHKRQEFLYQQVFYFLTTELYFWGRDNIKVTKYKYLVIFFVEQSQWYTCNTIFLAFSVSINMILIFCDFNIALPSEIELRCLKGKCLLWYKNSFWFAIL